MLPQISNSYSRCQSGKDFERLLARLSPLGLEGHEHLKVEYINSGEGRGGWALSTQAKPCGIGRLFSWLFRRESANIDQTASVMAQIFLQNAPLIKAKKPLNWAMMREVLLGIQGRIRRPCLDSAIDQVLIRIAHKELLCLTSSLQEEYLEAGPLIYERAKKEEENRIDALCLKYEHQKNAIIEEMAFLTERIGKEAKNLKAIESDLQRKQLKMVLSNPKGHVIIDWREESPGFNALLRTKEGDVFTHTAVLEPCPYFKRKLHQLSELPCEVGKDGQSRLVLEFYDFPLSGILLLNRWYWNASLPENLSLSESLDFLFVAHHMKERLLQTYAEIKLMEALSPKQLVEYIVPNNRLIEETLIPEKAAQMAAKHYTEWARLGFFDAVSQRALTLILKNPLLVADEAKLFESLFSILKRRGLNREEMADWLGAPLKEGDKDERPLERETLLHHLLFEHIPLDKVLSQGIPLAIELALEAHDIAFSPRPKRRLFRAPLPNSGSFAQRNGHRT